MFKLLHVKRHVASPKYIEPFKNKGRNTKEQIEKWAKDMNRQLIKL